MAKIPKFREFLREEVDEPTPDSEEDLSGPTAQYGAGEEGSEWFESTNLPKFRSFLFESADYSSGTKQFHNQAIRHKYRAGTKVGTVGYHTAKGGFTHVYHHEKNGDEIHIYKSKEGKVEQWTHVSEDGAIHRLGKDFGAFKTHLEEYHPETLKEEERIRKEKERAAKAAKKKPKKKK